MMDGFDVGDKVRHKRRPLGVGEVMGYDTDHGTVRVRWIELANEMGNCYGNHKPKHLILVAEAVSGGEEAGVE